MSDESNALGDLTGTKSAIRLDGFARVDATVVAGARGLSTATVHEAAGKIGAMPSAIKPIDPGFRLCGPAVTVFSHRLLFPPTVQSIWFTSRVMHLEEISSIRDLRMDNDSPILFG